MSEVHDDGEVSIVTYDVYMPDDFHEWDAEAQRVWLAGGLTQLQMLNYAADELGLDEEFDELGSMTNRDLARFLTALMESHLGGEASL